MFVRVNARTNRTSPIVGTINCPVALANGELEEWLRRHVSPTSLQLIERVKRKLARCKRGSVQYILGLYINKEGPYFNLFCSLAFMNISLDFGASCNENIFYYNRERQNIVYVRGCLANSLELGECRFDTNVDAAYGLAIEQCETIFAEIYKCHATGDMLDRWIAIKPAPATQNNINNNGQVNGGGNINNSGAAGEAINGNNNNSVLGGTGPVVTDDCAPIMRCGDGANLEYRIDLDGFSGYCLPEEASSVLKGAVSVRMKKNGWYKFSKNGHMFVPEQGFIPYKKLSILRLGEQASIVGPIHLGIAVAGVVDFANQYNTAVSCLKNCAASREIKESARSFSCVISNDDIAGAFAQLGAAFNGQNLMIIVESFGNKRQTMLELTNYQRLLDGLDSCINYRALSNFEVDVCASAYAGANTVLLAGDMVFDWFKVTPNYNLFLSNDIKNYNAYCVLAGNDNVLTVTQDCGFSKINLYSSLEDIVTGLNSSIPHGYAGAGMFERLYGIKLKQSSTKTLHIIAKLKCACDALLAQVAAGDRPIPMARENVALPALPAIGYRMEVRIRPGQLSQYVAAIGTILTNGSFSYLHYSSFVSVFCRSVSLFADAISCTINAFANELSCLSFEAILRSLTSEIIFRSRWLAGSSNLHCLPSRANRLFDGLLYRSNRCIKVPDVNDIVSNIILLISEPSSVIIKLLKFHCSQGFDYDCMVAFIQWYHIYSCSPVRFLDLYYFYNTGGAVENRTQVREIVGNNINNLDNLNNNLYNNLNEIDNNMYDLNNTLNDNLYNTNIINDNNTIDLNNIIYYNDWVQVSFSVSTGRISNIFAIAYLILVERFGTQLPGVFEDIQRVSGSPIYVFPNLLSTAETRNNYLNYICKLVFTRDPATVRAELISAINIMPVDSSLPRSFDEIVRLVYGLIIYCQERIRYPLICDNLFFKFKYIRNQEWLKNRRSNMRTLITNPGMLRRLLAGIRNIRFCQFDRVAYVEYAHQHGLYLNAEQLNNYETVYNMDTLIISKLATNLNINSLTDREILSRFLKPTELAKACRAMASVVPSSSSDNNAYDSHSSSMIVLSSSSLEIISSSSVSISSSSDVIILTNDFSQYSIQENTIQQAEFEQLNNSLDYARESDYYVQETDWYEPLDFSPLVDNVSVDNNNYLSLNEPSNEINNITIDNNLNATISVTEDNHSEWSIERLHLLNRLLSDDDIKHFMILYKKFAFSSFRTFSANYRLFGSGSDPGVTGIHDVLERLTEAGLLFYSGHSSFFNIAASNICIEYLSLYLKYLKLRNYTVKNYLRQDEITKSSIIRGLGLRAKSETECNACIESLIQYGFISRYINENKTKYALLNI